MVIKRNINTLGYMGENVNAQTLNIIMNDEHNKLITDKRGNICFIGSTEKYRKIIWKDLTTGKIANEVSAQVRYIFDNNELRFSGYLVCDEPIEDDEVIVYDMQKVNKACDNFDLTMFIITDESLEKSIKQSINNGIVYMNSSMYSNISQIRLIPRGSEIGMYIEKTIQNVTHFDNSSFEKRNCWYYSDNRCYVAYCNHNKNAIINGNIIKSQADSVDRIVFCCAAQKAVKEVVSVEDCAHVLGSRGYMYIEPFSVSADDMTNAKIEIIANRNLPLEIYDENQNEWTAFETGMIGKCSDSNQIKLRIAVETGDYVRNIFMNN